MFKKGFTLAEVLVTLGIIGVIAAMTLPVLVAKYQKVVFITKMKYTYTILSEAFLRAQEAHGAPSTWDWGVGLGTSNTERILKTYIIPYLSVSSEGRCKGVGTNTRGYCFQLKNGITVTVRTDGSWDTSQPDGFEDADPGCLYFMASLKNKQSYTLYADRDYSREDFVLQIRKVSKKLEFFNWGGSTREGIKNTSQYACNKSIAKNQRLNCGALIFYDGWQIKDDYPW